MSPAVSRALALLLLALVLGALGAATIVPAWKVYREDAVRIEEYNEQVNRFSGIAARLPKLEKTLGRYLELWKAHQGLMPQSSAALAGASLQERLKTLVTHNGGELNSTRVLTTGETEGFPVVSLSARMRLSNAALHRILHALEGGIPHLLIENIHVASLSGEKSAELDVSITLSGLMRPGISHDP